MTGLARHTLVWLSQPPHADREQDGPLVAHWQAAGRPFVVCRRRGEGDGLWLGFCAAHEKFPEIRPRRVGARAPSAEVVRTAAPPALAEVARCAPAADHAPAFARLAEGAVRAGLDLRVYGSWMWQALTGERHVRPSSDLDLLARVDDLRQAEDAAAVLEGLESGLSFRLDGELSFAGLGEVQWREFRGSAPEVLLKAVDGVRMVRREALRP